MHKLRVANVCGLLLPRVPFWDNSAGTHLIKAHYEHKKQGPLKDSGTIYDIELF